MTSAASNPHRLRLVGREPDPSEARQRADADRARLEVIKENRITAHTAAMMPGFEAGIDATDPRWILAMQTQSRLQGSTLTPERRDELLRKGARLGMRKFEANLVIAIVQDRARAGLAANQAAPFLSLVRTPNGGKLKPSAVFWPKLLAAVAAGATLAAILIRWLAA